MFEEDTDEADYEDDDTANMLDDDRAVSDEGPEVVGLQAGITLEVFEEGILIGVIVWVFSALERSQLNSRKHT